MHPGQLSHEYGEETCTRGDSPKCSKLGKLLSSLKNSCSALTWPPSLLTYLRAGYNVALEGNIPMLGNSTGDASNKRRHLFVYIINSVLCSLLGKDCLLFFLLIPFFVQLFHCSLLPGRGREPCQDTWEHCRDWNIWGVVNIWAIQMRFIFSHLHTGCRLLNWGNGSHHWHYTSVVLTFDKEPEGNTVTTGHNSCIPSCARSHLLRSERNSSTQH